MKNNEFLLKEISMRLYADVKNIIDIYQEENELCINIDYRKELYISIINDTIYVYSVNNKNKVDCLMLISMKHEFNLIYKLLLDYFNNVNIDKLD